MKKNCDIINETVKYIVGDGIITYYENGLPTKHKIISNYGHTRKT